MFTKDSKVLRNCALFVGMLMILFGLMSFGLVPPQSEAVEAATVIGYQTVTLEDGTDAYTETTYTSGYLSGSFGEIVLQINSDISGTETLTVTPQFSSDGYGCTSAATWADGTISGVYVVNGASTVTVSTLNTNTLTTTVQSSVSTVSYDSIAIVTTIAGDAATLLRFPSMGKCMRVKMAVATTFTPTMYAWMVNTQ